MRSEPGNLAGLWTSAFQALVSRAAHEVNNALNGAIVNLEVVKAKARPGVDAAAVAPFAAAASDQLDETATLAGALLALGRTPRGTTDLAATLRVAVTLLGPAARHDRVALEVAGPRSCATAADPIATRLAIVAALLAVVDAAGPDSPTVEIAGADSASDPARPIRCTIRGDERPMLELGPSYGAVLPNDVIHALARADIAVSDDSGILRLAFPASGAPY